MTSDGPAADWRSAASYADLLRCDRRAFAWEWLRRSPVYRGLWSVRDRLPVHVPIRLGLLAWLDPSLAAPAARPMWDSKTDPSVLDGHPSGEAADRRDLLDIRELASFVSVEIDESHTEHWLLSDGHWAVRLDLHDGTLLGGPILVEQRLTGLRAAAHRLDALRRLIALSARGDLPVSLRPRERRAAQWILELRVGDAIMGGAGQQEIARELFSSSIAPRRWRLESASYRLRVQRLVRVARRRLADPLNGPWFD